LRCVWPLLAVDVRLGYRFLCINNHAAPAVVVE